MTPDDTPQEKPTASDDKTIPSRPDRDWAAETIPSRQKAEEVKVMDALTPAPPAKAVAKPEVRPETAQVTPPPWPLQQFFNGEIDLDAELAQRFPNTPVMSSIHFRGLGTKTGRGVATLTTADGAASVIFDADTATRVVQMSFTFGSMLTLRFSLDELSDMDRSRWLELMRREQGGLAFLWGPARWERDYLICVSRKYYTNLYAFSIHHFDAAIRMTPEVMKKLLNWLEQFWKTPPPDEEPPKLLTW